MTIRNACFQFDKVARVDMQCHQHDTTKSYLNHTKAGTKFYDHERQKATSKTERLRLPKPVRTKFSSRHLDWVLVKSVHLPQLRYVLKIIIDMISTFSYSVSLH